MLFEDGTGAGYAVKVTKRNRMTVDSVNQPKMSLVSNDDGLAFSWTNASYDYDAGDTIILIKNTSTTHNLIIDDIIIAGDTATIATVHFPVCDTPTGTSITGVNLNRTSGKTADATAIGDETTNSQGPIYHNIFIEANKTYEHDAGDSIVLGTNNCIAVDFVANGTAAYCTIEGFFLEI